MSSDDDDDGRKSHKRNRHHNKDKEDDGFGPSLIPQQAGRRSRRQQQEQPTSPRYRDRAKERREDATAAEVVVEGKGEKDENDEEDEVFERVLNEAGRDQRKKREMIHQRRNIGTRHGRATLTRRDRCCLFHQKIKPDVFPGYIHAASDRCRWHV